MARCSGCSGDRCSCVIRAGANISISGAGSATNPYVVTAAGDEGQAVPTGTIVMFGGAAVPAGWLSCNGGAVSRVAQAALYAAIGTTFGVGDGSTTFNLPNFLGKFPIGATTAPYALGSSGGNYSYMLTAANIPQHSHTMNHDHPNATTGAMNGNQVHSHTFDGGITAYQAGIAGGIHFAQSASNPGYGSFIGGANVDHTHNFDVPAYSGSTGNYGTAVPTAVPTVPPFLAVNFLIKT